MVLGSKNYSKIQSRNTCRNKNALMFEEYELKNLEGTRLIRIRF